MSPLLRWLAVSGLAAAAAALFWWFDPGRPADSPAASSFSPPAHVRAIAPAAAPAAAALTAAPTAAPMPGPDDGTPPVHVVIQGNAAEAFAAAIKAGNEKPAAEPPPAIAQARSFREAFEAMRQAERQPPAASAGLNPFGSIGR